MLRFFAWANKYRKWVNVGLNTFDDFQKNYENEFGEKFNNDGKELLK
jgi:uncharacterized protein YeaO (DUF488 family)